jgi:hypothetical protein
VIGFLRCFGVLNAGIWFGASVFFTFAVGPAVFSEDMKGLLEKFFPRYSGEIAQILIARYFRLQVICGVIALFHLLGENLYFGRAPQKIWLALLAALIALTLLGDFGLQPKMNQLHRIKYAVNSSPERREAATESFKTWHGISQMANLLMMIGLGVHLCRVASPREDTRFIGAGKFRS